MDLDSAIVAHSSWKNKLKTYLEKKDGSLKASEVQSDQNCPLGQWIYGEGQKIGSDPTFRELKKQHTKFHTVAEGLVRKVDSGQSVAQDLEVGSKSEFLACTATVVNLLAKLKKETH